MEVENDNYQQGCCSPERGSSVVDTVLHMRRLVTEITIQASPADVWDALTQLERYGEWNPFIIEAKGTIAMGEHLEVKMQQPGRKPITFRPTVTEVVSGSVFEWLGHLGVGGIFDGRHRFELEEREDGTRLTHSETFTGIIVPLLFRVLERGTTAGFEAMNAALKTRVESASQESAE